MAIFSEDEFQQFNMMVEEGKSNAMKGKKPSISSVLMSLQFATTMPHEDGKMWFQDTPSRLLIMLSIRKLMQENTPDMFSVAEKAYMMNVLNTCSILTAIDNAGFDLADVLPTIHKQDSNESDETEENG